MLKDFFSIKFQSIAAAAVVIAAANLLSRLVGVVRDRVLASRFGAGDELDVYYAAFRVPDFIFNLIVLGALSVVFIPIFVGLIKNENAPREKDNQLLWDFASNVLNILFIFLFGSAVLLAVASPWLVPIITPGFSAEKMHLTVNLTRLMLISPILLGLSSIFSDILQSFKRFFIFSLAPVVYNLGIIVGALFFTPKFGIYGLGLGVILGGLGHLLVQVPFVFQFGFIYRLIINFHDSNFLKMLKMTGPRILGLASGQINLVIITIFASIIASGSLAVFNLANNLQSFLLGLIGVSFAIAAFPALTKCYSDNDEESYKRIFHRAFGQILFFIIPGSLLLIILRMQVVRVVLGSGKFNWEDTILTGNSLGIFCLSLFAQALIPLLARAFYARHNTMIPFYAALTGLIVNAVVSWLIIKKIGVLGLAAGFSAGSIANFAVLFVFLRLKVKGIGANDILSSLLKISAASLIMAVAAQYVKTGIGNLVDMQRFWGIATQGAGAALAGLIVFVVVGLLLKSEELLNFIASLKRRLWREVKVGKEGIVN